MTLDINWSKIKIDHVIPTCLFDISKGEEEREAFIWKNTQHLSKDDHQHKETKFVFLAYRLQIMKSYQIIKLKEQGLN